MLVALLQAMRPAQWVKNILVLAPLVFSHKMTDPQSILYSLWAVLVFCLLSSSIYLLNDVVDRQADQSHPVKKHRPIASGRLPVAVAHVFTLGLGIIALVLAFWLAEAASDRVGPRLSTSFVAWPLAYFILQLGYSFFLKRIIIVDCLCIALGFLFRVHAGSVAIGVSSSSWILLCTFFFALFLAFAKRREEVDKVSDGSGRTRATMRDYSVDYLNQLISSLAALSILSYALYTLADSTVEFHGSHNLMITVPIVVFGVFRYQFLVWTRGEGGNPSRLLFRDPPLIISGILYLAAVWVALSCDPILDAVG